MLIKKRIPNGIKKDGVIEGYRTQINRASSRARAGEARNGRVFAGVGAVSSFVNSFNASASGCGRPIKLTLFGPFRSWK